MPSLAQADSPSLVQGVGGVVDASARGAFGFRGFAAIFAVF